MGIICREKLQKVIEPHIFIGLKGGDFDVGTILASELLIGARFDLAFKLLYLDLKTNCFSYASRVYSDHIRAFTLGRYVEPGNAKKDGVDVYMDVFNSLYENRFFC